MLPTATDKNKIAILRELAKLHGSYAPAQIVQTNISETRLPSAVEELLSSASMDNEILRDEEYLKAVDDNGNDGLSSSTDAGATGCDISS